MQARLFSENCQYNKEWMEPF